MKKTIMTIAILLGVSLTTFADPNASGLFQRGAGLEYNGISGNKGGEGLTPMLPNHNKTDNQNANVPLGSGITILAVFGGAYLVGKRRKQD
jgi:hypothetical protein